MRTPSLLLAAAFAPALAAPASACQAVLGMRHPAAPRVIAPVQESLTTCGGSGVCVFAGLGYANPTPLLDEFGNPEVFSGASVTGAASCSPVPGDFTCLFEGSGEYTAQLVAEVSFSLGSRCKAVVAKEFFIDTAPPGLSFEPDPSGKILSSTETFDLVAVDDAGVAAIEADSVFVWGHPLRPEGGPDNIFNYPVYDPARRKVSVAYPLSDKRGAQNLHARALDHPLNEAFKDAQFSVDAELPKVSISTPLLASSDGTLQAVRGTASDDLGLSKVEVALETAAGGGLDWRDAGAVSGTEADWTYGGFTETIPLTGALWTVHARVTDLYGRTAEASTTVLIVPAVNLVEVLGVEAQGQACAPRVDQWSPFSSVGTDPTHGRASILMNSGGQPGNSPALNIATAFHSKSPKDSVWGWGWSSMHDQTLFLRPSGAVRWTGGELSKKNFFPPPSGDEYISPIQEFAKLSVTERASGGAPSRFSLKEKDGAVFAFVRSTGTLFVLESFTDRNGNPLTYHRDAQGRLNTITDVHNRTLALAYTNGRVASITDDAGRVVAFTYDAQGRKRQESGPKGTTAYDYDTSTRVIKVTFPNLGSRTFSYDAQDRVLTQTDDLDGVNTAVTSYAYFPSSTVVTDPLGRQTVLDLSKKSGLKVANRVAGPGATTFSQYDADFFLKRSSDPRGNFTDFGYDANGNVTSVLGPEGVSTSLSYDQTFNRPTSIINPRGLPTTLGYNPSNGDLTLVTDALSRPTNLQYDGQGHVTGVLDPDSNLTQFGYTAGALTSVTDAESRQTVLTRDPQGRVQTALDPDNRLTTYGYDDQDNLTSVLDALNGVTSYGYAPGTDGRLLASVMDARQAVTNLKTTTFDYDRAGRLKTVTDPNGITRTYQYDGAGRLTDSFDGKNQHFNFTYDANDRLDLKTTPDGVYDYDFDANGNLTKAGHPNGSLITQAFDGQDRPTTVSQRFPDGFTVTLANGYDANGNRTSLVTPWGTFLFGYDALDRMDAITGPGMGPIAIHYDQAGRRDWMTYPNPNVRAAYAYDRAGLLLSVEHTRTIGVDTTLIARSSYSYSDAGDRLTMSDLNGTHSYRYDPLHRLIEARHHPMVAIEHTWEGFDYDQAGNRLAGDGVTGYSYDDGNRLLSNSSFSYTHDANGNATTRTELATGQTATLTYDAENRLIRVDRPDGAFVTFKYDAQGRRIEKTVTAGPQSATSRYVYDNEDILAVLDGNNQLVAWFAHGPGIDEPLAMNDQGRSRILIADGLGSVTAVAEEDGTIVERIDYEAYGLPTFIDLRGPTPVYSQAPVTANMHAFTARAWDGEVGLYNYRARAYDPEAGRFVQADPIGLRGGTNQFIYGANNPARYIDPFGLDPHEGIELAERYILEASGDLAAAHGRAWREREARHLESLTPEGKNLRYAENYLYGYYAVAHGFHGGRYPTFALLSLGVPVWQLIHIGQYPFSKAARNDPPSFDAMLAGYLGLNKGLGGPPRVNCR